MPTCKRLVAQSNSDHSLSAGSQAASDTATTPVDSVDGISLSLWNLYLEYAAVGNEQVGADSDGVQYSYQFGWMNNKKFIKQLQKDNIDLAILQSEIGAVSTKRRKKSWRERLLHVIRSNVVQIILCALVLIDAVIVIAEIILEIKAITSEKVALEGAFVKTAGFVNRTFAPCLSERGLLLPELTQRLISAPQFAERLASSMLSILLAIDGRNSTAAACDVTVVAAASAPTTASPVRSSATAGRAAAASASLRVRRAVGGGGSGAGGGVRLFGGYQQDYSHAKLLHDVSSVLHYVSIGILGLFVLEVALKVACLGRNFVREKFEIVDAAVIMISFVADIVFVKLESTEVSVMVLFLLWRIVRVINGLMMHEKQRDEFRIQLQKRARRMSEMKCDTLETERDLQEKQILFLEELCRELGGSDEQIGNCKPRFVNISKRQSNNALKSMAAMSAGIFGGIAGAQHRRSLSVLTGNLGSGTPPTTSRQSSGLDTIAEDADTSRASGNAEDDVLVVDEADDINGNGDDIDGVSPPVMLNGQTNAIKCEQEQQLDQPAKKRQQTPAEESFNYTEPRRPPQRPRQLVPTAVTAPIAATQRDPDGSLEENPWELREDVDAAQTRRVLQEASCVTEYLATT